jgi:hypothetical protein
MQNREELRRKGHDGSQKITCRERGKKYHFQKEGGNKYLFGPKYRPLFICEKTPSPLTYSFINILLLMDNLFIKCSYGK